MVSGPGFIRLIPERYMKSAKKRIVLLTAFLSMLFIATLNAEEKGVIPNINPGEVIKMSDFFKTKTARGVTIQVFRGKGIQINRITLKKNAQFQTEPFPGDCVTVVLKGNPEKRVYGEYVTLNEKDCIYQERGAENILKAGSGAAEIMEFCWPDSADIEKSKPYVKPGMVYSRNYLQFCQPEKNMDARIFHGRRGQVCFIRMRPDSRFPPVKYPLERFIIVTRGWMEHTVNGKTARMEKGDIIYLTVETVLESKTGPKGCDVITVFSPSNPDYTTALDKRIERFHSIIFPHTHPELLIDGTKEEPGLTMTEGPSWMNGKLYFSNYYKYWKPWGSSDEGGVWVIESDGSFRVLNKDVQTCGTTPLPNGNLAVCDLFKRGVVEMTPDGVMGRTIVDSYNGIPFGVANDIITDRKGGLYITDSSVARKGKKQPGTALYYLNSQGELTRVTEPDDVGYINGVVVNPDDKILYLNGSAEVNVWMFDINEDGTLSNKRMFAELYVPDKQLDREKPFSTADGMTMDRAGNIYVATGLGIQIFDKAGGFMGIIHFPKTPSHCVFGGDDLSTLYVTAREHIYSIKTKMKGFQYPIE